MSSCLGIEGFDSSLISLLPSVTGSLDASLCQVMVRRPSLTTSGGMSQGCCVGGSPSTWCVCLAFFFSFSFGFLLESSILILCVFLCFHFTVRDHLELESRFAERVCAAVEYASTIDDFDDLVDPRTLARHCLGQEPSHYIFHAIHHEEKSELFYDTNRSSIFPLW